MATALWTTPLHLKQNSVITGDLDDDKITYSIKNAQIIHLQGFLGTDLYNGLQERSVAGTLSANDNLLINDYIESALIFWTLSDYVFTAAYNISNKGILKHRDETSETISKEEITALGLSYQKTAEHFSQRLISYLCDNSHLYPEYNTNSGSDINPETNSNYGGLYLG